MGSRRGPWPESLTAKATQTMAAPGCCYPSPSSISRGGGDPAAAPGLCSSSIPSPEGPLGPDMAKCLGFAPD